MELMIQHQLWHCVPVFHLHQRELEQLANGADYLDHPKLLKIYLEEIRRRIRECRSGSALVKLLEIDTSGQVFKYLNETLWSIVWSSFYLHEVERLQTGLEIVDSEIRSLVRKSSRDNITPSLVSRYPNIKKCISPCSIRFVDGWQLRELSLTFASLEESDVNILLSLNLEKLNLRGSTIHKEQLSRLKEKFDKILIT